tara:strand:- start:238 stop:441 length:204 start_codon:yes stop_codon:yes gene_type:complete
MNNNITIVPPIREGHSDSDYAKEMNSKGNKDFGTGYCCGTFYGMDMFTDDMICYWCEYGDDWYVETE